VDVRKVGAGVDGKLGGGDELIVGEGDACPMIGDGLTVTSREEQPDEIIITRRNILKKL
jgi:hypothetical protein